MDKYHLWLHKYHRASFIWFLLHKFGWKVQTPSCPALWFDDMMFGCAVDREILLKPSLQVNIFKSDPHTKFSDRVSFQGWFSSANTRIPTDQSNLRILPQLLPIFTLSILRSRTPSLPQQPRAATGQDKSQQPARGEKTRCFWTCHFWRWHCRASAVSVKSLEDELQEASAGVTLWQFLGTQQGWMATGPFVLWDTCHSSALGDIGCPRSDLKSLGVTRQLLLRPRRNPALPKIPQEQEWQPAALQQQPPSWDDSLSTMSLFRFSHELLNWKHWSTLLCMAFDFCFFFL